VTSEIGRRTKHLRRERGWNQSDLARKSGVSISWVSRLEAGLFENPSAPMLAKIAGALRVPVDDLTNGPAARLSAEDERELEGYLRDPDLRVAFAQVGRLGDSERQFVLDFIRRFVEHGRAG
jgi:putative transcriptional regulator